MALKQPTPKDTVVFHTGGFDNEELLRISPEGFYVRGVKVPVDDREAEIVYNSFQQWLAWAQLQR